MGWRHGQQWVNVGGRRYVERVLVRYRYRAYPTLGQAALLARTFGCARVVFNDALRARQDAHAAGEKISDTQVQRKVVTLAKTTPQRQWLGEVASVALVQCSPGVVAWPALCAVERDGDQGGGRAVLRIVCGRGGRHTAAREHQRGRDRPWPGEPGRVVHW